MGLRVDTDVAWKLEPEFSQLSEDGFCPRCDEHYSDCFCEAYWIRLLRNSRKNYEKVDEKLKILRRYHGGDSSVTKKQVVEALGLE